MSKLDTTACGKRLAKDFAAPETRGYPIEDQAHTRNAKAQASHASKEGRLSKAGGEQDRQKG